mmetsp:Transcript_4435/g.9210  ORF Transcript_4435/g.9210 Transcript_4435/m.9210 type:complete len:449 (-) Transcript_4435:315-1661(-)
MMMMMMMKQQRLAVLVLSMMSLLPLFIFPNIRKSLAEHHGTIDKTHQQVEQVLTTVLGLNNNNNDNNNNNNKTSSQQQEEEHYYHTIQPRAFHAWPIAAAPLPCVDPFAEVNVSANETWWQGPVQKRPPLAGQGLLYLKLTKSASTTASGVHLRVAQKLAQRRQHSTQQQQQQQQSSRTAGTTNITTTPWPVCRVRFLHGWAGPRMFRYQQRDRTTTGGGSFLWTTVRQPTARYVSEFFHFHVGRAHRPATGRSFQHFCRRGPHADHHSLSWLSVRGYRYGKSDPWQTARDIVQDYDFIGVVERLDESLVVLSMLLHIPLRDVLYVSSKVSGTYDDLCIKIPPTKLTVPMKEYIASEEWQAYIAPEVALWKAANASLDLTVTRLGRARVATALQQFQSVMAVVHTKCSDVRFPCSANGTRNDESDCFVKDMGCGWGCIDRIADEMGLP